jgi:hypothetical protein
MDFRVSWIGMYEISWRKYDSFLVENFRRRN